MPTGYTANIKDGISFQTYAMNCARAFGACIMMRDDPAGGDRIPDSFQPSDYNIKAATKSRTELAELDLMTPPELARAASKEWDEAETSRVVSLQNRRDQKTTYEAMLAKVQKWAAPTSEHEGLHKFMAEQIEQSIKFDCDLSYGNTPATRSTGEEWAANHRAKLLRDIAYHDKSQAEEVARAAERTEWVRALRASL